MIVSQKRQSTIIKIYLSNMDTHFLKITGKMNIPKELEVDKSYTIALDWACTDTTKKSNQDGTYTFVHSFQWIHCMINSELWERILAKDTRSNSTKLRASLKWKYDNTPELYSKYDSFETFYDLFFIQIHRKLEFLISEIP